LWADTIAELWDDEERRAELGRRGRVQAQRFSWVRAARETLQVYRRAVDGRTPLIAPPSVAVSAGTPAQTLAVPLSALGETHCPRCGAAWFDAQLTVEAHVQPADMSSPPLQLDRAARLCPKCGRVQLQAHAAQPAETAVAAVPEPTPREPALMANMTSGAASLDETSLVEIASEVAPLELPPETGETHQPADQQPENGVETPDLPPRTVATETAAEQLSIVQATDLLLPAGLPDTPAASHENGVTGDTEVKQEEHGAVVGELPHDAGPPAKTPGARSSRRKKARPEKQ